MCSTFFVDFLSSTMRSSLLYFLIEQMIPILTADLLKSSYDWRSIFAENLWLCLGPFLGHLAFLEMAQNRPNLWVILFFCVLGHFTLCKIVVDHCSHLSSLYVGLFSTVFTRRGFSLPTLVLCRHQQKSLLFHSANHPSPSPPSMDFPFFPNYKPVSFLSENIQIVDSRTVLLNSTLEQDIQLERTGYVLGSET